MADSTSNDQDDLTTRTPGSIAQQNAHHIQTMDMFGLSSFPSPWDDVSPGQAPGDNNAPDDKEKENQRKRAKIKQQREEQESKQQQDRLDMVRQVQALHWVAEREKKAQEKGDPMDPEAAAEMFQKSMGLVINLTTGGVDLSSMLTDTVKEVLVKGEAEGQDTKEDTSYSQRPSRN